MSVLITLVYKCGNTWFAGEFPSQAAADAWVAQEKSRPYWDVDTQVVMEIKTSAIQQ